ncbi:MAG TPA: lipid II flippase MurJ [Micromonospora sp.]|nr:lipid II flippase MurJ [Micromonospora sp.]
MADPTPLGTGRIAGAATLIAVLTVASRLAGFGRNVVFTWLMGEHSDLGDMYVVANTLPNIIFEIVAGGALASLVVPLLAGAVAVGDRATVAATTGALLTWILTLLVPLALLVALLAEPIIGLLAVERPDLEIAAGARMLRVFAPQLPLYGIGIVLTGVLQAHRRFAWPVIAPLLSSVTVIGVYYLFALREGVRVGIAHVSRSGELILSVGTTLGVVVLSLSLLIPLRRLRLRLRPGYRFTAEARRKVGGLALAGAVTVAAQQIALLVLLRQLTGGPKGAAVIFNLAQALYLLPWAVLAVPLAVAAYPTLAAAHATGDEAAYRRILAPATRGVLLLSCLGAAALVATAEPVAHFFWPDAAPSSVAAIAGFGPGLIGYGLFAVLTRALYARGGARSAAAVTALGWLAVPAAAVTLSAILAVEYRVLAVTLGNSIGMLVLGALLVTAVLRGAGRAALAGLTRSAGVGLAAGLAAALAGVVVAHVLTPLLGGGRGWGALLPGVLTAAVVAAVFFAMAYPLDRQDVRPLLNAAWGRIHGMSRRWRPDRSKLARPGGPGDGKE